MNARLGMSVALHVHVHGSVHQLSPRGAYRETPRNSQLSFFFLLRTYTFACEMVSGRACVRARARMCAKHICNASMYTLG